MSMRGRHDAGWSGPFVLKALDDTQAIAQPRALISTRTPLNGSSGVPGSFDSVFLENSLSHLHLIITCSVTGGYSIAVIASLVKNIGIPAIPMGRLDMYGA